VIYGYARVSAAGQASNGNGLEAQEKALREAGAEEVYSDGCTGTKRDRPRLNALINRLRSGDVLIVTKLDRIAEIKVLYNTIIQIAPYKSEGAEAYKLKVYDYLKRKYDELNLRAGRRNLEPVKSRVGYIQKVIELELAGD
jgi:hypothetical protein